MLWFTGGRPTRRIHSSLAVDDSAGLRHIRAVAVEAIDTPLKVEADEAKSNPAALVAAMTGDLIAAEVYLPVVLQALSEPNESGEDISARALASADILPKHKHPSAPNRPTNCCSAPRLRLLG